MAGTRLMPPNIIVLALALVPLQLLHAQDDCAGSCKINSNLAMVLNVPVSSTAQVEGTGWGATGGVGYNINPPNAVIGEFLWNRMYPSGWVLQPLQATSSQLGSLDGNSNLYALTGNYRYEFQGRLFGTYLIGGGGWYYRKNWLSRGITAGPGTVCTPAWLWWGFSCTSGMVTANQTRATTGTSAWGMNAGVGLHGKSWRRSLPALYGGALSLCPDQGCYDAVHRGYCRNSLLNIPTRGQSSTMP